jgi:hypothetical protein
MEHHRLGLQGAVLLALVALQKGPNFFSKVLISEEPLQIFTMLIKWISIKLLILSYNSHQLELEMNSERAHILICAHGPLHTLPQMDELFYLMVGW